LSHSGKNIEAARLQAAGFKQRDFKQRDFKWRGGVLRRRLMSGEVALRKLAQWSLRSCTALGVLAFAGAASAQMTLSTAVDFATKNDPRVRMAQADLDRARSGLAQTKDAYIPSVSANGGFGSSTGVPLSLPVVFSISSQSLLFNFSQHDNLRAAAFAVHSAELALKEAQAKVAEDVVTTYIDLDNASRRQAVVKEQYGYATRLRQIVSDRFDAGQDTKLDTHNANLTADRINLNALEILADTITEEDHLARLVGLPGTVLHTVHESIPVMPDPQSFSDSSFISFGVRSAFADAHSKQEMAFGEARYRWRPQIGFGANYSRVSTAHTNYSLYYPGFLESNGVKHSDNSLSVGLSITIPLFDKLHDDKAKGAAADAAHARAEAVDSRNQFLEGRVKLENNAALLSARVRLSGDEKDLAEDQLEATLAQLSADNGASAGPQMTPKDEQNARIQLSAKKLDALSAELSLEQAEINLLRQTNGLSDWLQQAPKAPTTITPEAAKP
jgi:outer membrane protein TolC